jgi:hypothetical protein
MTRIEAERIIRPVSIAAGATGLSAEVNIGGFELMALEMPTAWTTANLTFKVARETGGTFYDLYDDAGNEVTVTVGGASRTITFDSTALKFAPIEWLKIRSGTTATPVDQVTARTLYLILKA